jgi:hypothetical protein
VNKSIPTVAVITCLALVAGGSTAMWLLRDRLFTNPKPASDRAAYDAMVERLGGDEPAVRDELNELICTASAPLDTTDRVRRRSLTRDCLDPGLLLDIEHVWAFVGAAARGEPDPYHFVARDQRARLIELAGESPSPEEVLAVRRALARLGADFEVMRQPPDWTVKVEGEPVAMPFLDLLREAHEFMPVTKHPPLRPDPRIPAFAGTDAELLAHLEQFFNTPRARAAFPSAKFPNLYRDGRIPPIPTALSEYRPLIRAGIAAEKRLLLPSADPDEEAVEAVDDVFDKLERFFAAIEMFQQRD